MKTAQEQGKQDEQPAQDTQDSDEMTAQTTVKRIVGFFSSASFWVGAVVGVLIGVAVATLL